MFIATLNCILRQQKILKKKTTLVYEINMKLLPAMSMAELRVCSVTSRHWTSMSRVAMASSVRDE